MESTGTTFVHMDKAGAVNAMLYSQPATDGQLLGARWDIWHPDSIYSLSKALSPEASQENCRMAQPIISEMSYITPAVNRSAFLNSGIPGWSTTQLPGDAVIIPPGCPHQVSLGYNVQHRDHCMSCPGFKQNSMLQDSCGFCVANGHLNSRNVVQYFQNDEHSGTTRDS